MARTSAEAGGTRDTTLPRARRGSTSDEAYERIRREILDGTLWPGDVVVEVQLAESLTMSRTPVREALLRLERENLLERSGRSLAVRAFTANEIADIFSVRAEIESYAAELASERIMAHEIDELDRIQQQMDELTEQHTRRPDHDALRLVTQLNIRFHQVVVRAARSAALERTVAHLVQTPLVYRAQQWYDDGDRRAAVAAHAALIDRFRARDADGAREVWRAHLLYGRERLVGKLMLSEAGGEPVGRPR